jgi:AcrR family transcriptional regulator
MAGEERPLRADAERNRRRLLAAADELFGERGLEVGVGEIAERASVGRGTVFRNFPTKEHLISAVVVERMGQAAARGRELLDAEDPTEALFGYLGEMIARQQTDKALFEAVADELLANPEVRSAHTALVETLDELLSRAQAEGQVRRDIGAIDVLMLTKGICQAASAFAQIDPELADRQLDLLRSALTAPSDGRALRGRRPTLEDLERAFPAPAPAAQPLKRVSSSSS